MGGNIIWLLFDWLISKIFSFGLKPYTDLSNNKVIELVTKSKDRELLPKPNICPDSLYKLMIRYHFSFINNN